MPKVNMCTYLDRQLKYFSDARIEQFKNIHSGKRCFIVGNGPSVRFNDLTKLTNEHVIGAIWFVLHKDYKNLKNVYFCFPSFVLWAHWHLPPLLHYSAKANPNTIYFMENTFLEFNKKYHYFPEDKTFYISTESGKRDGSKIQMDLTRPVPFGQTVVQDLMLPLAYYMGFKEIILIGCDSDHNLKTHPDWSHSHFYPMSIMPLFLKIHLRDHSKGLDPERLDNVYIKFKNYFEKNNRKIYDATVGGKLTTFEKIEYESLF